MPLQAGISNCDDPIYSSVSAHSVTAASYRLQVPQNPTLSFLIQWIVAAPRDPLLFSAYNRLQTANNFVHVLQATKWDFYILCPTINSLNGKGQYTRISFFSHRRGFPPDTNIGWKQAIFSRPTRVDKSLWLSRCGFEQMINHHSPQNIEHHMEYCTGPWICAQTFIKNSIRAPGLGVAGKQY